MAILLLSKTTGSRDLGSRFFHEIGGTPKCISYIPSAPDPKRHYFQKIQNEYESLGIEELVYCDIYEGLSDNVARTISSSDLIILPGGFTPVFLKALQDLHLLEHLKKFAKSGGHFIGASAGALIMGSNLSILFDDPEEGEAIRSLDNIQGIGLYNFEFFPHFGRLDTHSDSLVNRSQYTKKIILACDDMSGIILNDTKHIAIGNVYKFELGTYKIVEDAELFI